MPTARAEGSWKSKSDIPRSSNATFPMQLSALVESCKIMPQIAHNQRPGFQALPWILDRGSHFRTASRSFWRARERDPCFAAMQHRRRLFKANLHPHQPKPGPIDLNAPLVGYAWAVSVTWLRTCRNSAFPSLHSLALVHILYPVCPFWCEIKVHDDDCLHLICSAGAAPKPQEIFWSHGNPQLALLNGHA